MSYNDIAEKIAAGIAKSNNKPSEKVDLWHISTGDVFKLHRHGEVLKYEVVKIVDDMAKISMVDFGGPIETVSIGYLMSA